MATRKNTLTTLGPRDSIAAKGRNAPVGASAGPAGKVGTRKSVVTNPSGSKRVTKMDVINLPEEPAKPARKAAAKPAAKKAVAKPAAKAKTGIRMVKLEEEIKRMAAAEKKRTAVRKEPTTIRLKGTVIPVGRVPGDDLEIPTILVKGVADTCAILAKMPRGSIWRTDTTVADASVINVFNRGGAHVVEIRHELKK